MKLPQLNISTSSWIIFILGGLLFWLAILNVGQFLQPKGRPTCRDFGSYTDALDSLHSGNTRLDADNDGKPCENKFRI